MKVYIVIGEEDVCCRSGMTYYPYRATTILGAFDSWEKAHICIENNLSSDCPWLQGEYSWRRGWEEIEFDDDGRVLIAYDSETMYSAAIVISEVELQ